MKEFRIYYNIHYKNAAIGFEYETKAVEVTMEDWCRINYYYENGDTEELYEY